MPPEGTNIKHISDAKKLRCGAYPWIQCVANECWNWQEIDTSRGYCWRVKNIKGQMRERNLGEI